MGKNEDAVKEEGAIKEYERLIKVGKENFFRLGGDNSKCLTKVNQDILANVFALGYTRGFAQGRVTEMESGTLYSLGLKDGDDSARKQIAKSMLGLDYTLAQVMEVTGVTMDYIDELTIKEMNLAKKGKK
jgi:hypothetical protein